MTVNYKWLHVLQNKASQVQVLEAVIKWLGPAVNVIKLFFEKI